MGQPSLAPGFGTGFLWRRQAACDLSLHDVRRIGSMQIFGSNERIVTMSFALLARAGPVNVVALVTAAAVLLTAAVLNLAMVQPVLAS